MLLCAPLARPSAPLLSIAPLFLLNLLIYSFCSTYCSTPLAQLVAPLLLLNLLLCFFCLTHFSFCSTCFAPLAWTVVQLLLFDLFARIPFYYIRDFTTPPPLFLASVECGRVVQIWILQIRVLRKVKIFVFNFCLLMSFFSYPCFWEMVVNNVFVFLCRNYLDIVHLIIHVASHFYTLHFIYTISLCIFWTHFFSLLNCS
jgi:hypothetical protein